MSQRHYQVIIIGDSLASSLAGVLLAKQGVRVLSFQNNASPSGPWFPSSLLLENILEGLSGRSCYTAPSPFQVITGDSRVELNGPFPMEEEFRREFTADHPRLTATLGQLAKTAERFENLLWPKGILPLYGSASRLAFAWQKLRSGWIKSELDRPLSSLFAEFSGTAAGDFLQTLFSGLAQRPLERLSVIEGALLWAGEIRERAISPSGLDALLRHRFEQFHGDVEELGAIQKIGAQGKRLAQIVLQNGGICSADQYLIDAPQGFSLLPKELQRPTDFQNHALIATAAFPEAQFPALLAPRVLLAGKNPLRLTFVSRERQVQCTLKTFRSNGEAVPDTSELQSCLDKLLPFSQASWQIVRPGETLPEQSRRSPFPGSCGPLKVAGNAIFHHGPGILPSLGAQGEVLAGLSTANRLLRLTRKK